MSSTNLPSTDVKAGSEANRELGPHAGPPSLPGRWHSVVPVAVTLGLLGALVWSFQPRQLKLKPAPLRSAPPGCQKPPREFVPTNITEIPSWVPTKQPASAAAAAFQALSRDQKERALLRLNMESCTCGCKLSVAACLVTEFRCDVSGKQARKMLREVSQH